MKRYFWNYLTQILIVKVSRFFSFNYPKQKFSQNYGDRDFEQKLLKINIQLLPKSLENANSTWNSLDRPTNWMALTPFLNVITKGQRILLKIIHNKNVLVKQFSNVKTFQSSFSLEIFFFCIKNISKQASDGLVLAFNINLHIFFTKQEILHWKNRSISSIVFCFTKA